MNRLEAFDDRDASAAAAARAIEGALREADARGFVATGGTTPGPAYDRLSKADLDWGRVTVTLSDERFVDPSSPDSNEGLVRRRLLVGHAAAARFAPLKGPGPTPNADAQAAEARLAPLLPFACVMIGMGADGHIGSLFPGAPELAEGLDPAGERLCVGVAMSGEKPFVPRISLTLRAFLSARLIVILVSGEEKRTVIDRVLTDPAYAPPVAALLRQTRVPVRILWAP
jgi:6-phosphogluconolactonase